MRVYALLSVLCLSTMFLTFFFSAPAQATYSWNVQVVDENSTTGGSSPIAVDSNNIAHVAYTASVNGTSYAMYASWNGTGWSTQTAVAGAIVTSLVLDSNNNPHLLLENIDSQNRSLMYAILNGTNWSAQNTGIIGAFNPALALDPYGNPSIAYVLGDALKYASLTGAEWRTQTVDNVPEGGGLSSLTFGSNNTAYLLYHVPTSYQDNSTGQKYQSMDIKLASLNDSVWNIQTVPLPQPLFDNGNLVLDTKGNPHFVCTQVRYRSSEDMNLFVTLLYASWNGSTWGTQTIVSDLQPTHYFEPSGSLHLDSNDTPNIASFVEAFSKITYISWNGNVWNIQGLTLDQPSDFSVSLALDGNGNPHISYRALSSVRFRAPLICATATETTPSSNPPNIPYLTSLAVAVVVGFTAVALVIVAVAFVWKRKEPLKKI